MKKSIFLFFVLANTLVSVAQTTFSWRNDQNPTSGQWNVSTYWWNGTGAALPGGAEILFLNGNVGTTMTNDLPAPNRYRIIFGSGGATRTINGTIENTFYDYSSNKPKIENNSSVNQIIAFPIKIGNANGLELNPTDGHLTFNGALSRQTYTLWVYTNSGTPKTIYVNSSFSGSGDIFLLNGSTMNIGSGGSIGGGVFYVENGTLTFSTGGAFGTITDIRISLSKTLNLNDVSITARSVAERATGDGGTISLGTGTLTLSGGWGTGTTIFQNSISGTGNLIKQGTGTLALYGTQSFTGSTTIEGEVLATSVSLSSNLITVKNSATFSATDNLTVNSITFENGSTLNVASGKMLTINGTMTVSGAITINGGGTIAFGVSGKLVYAQTANNLNYTAGIEWPASNGPTDVTVDLTGTGSPTVTIPSGRTINGTLTLTAGLLAGTLSYGANGILKYNGTSYTATSNVEFPSSSGPKDLNVTVANSAGINLHATRTLSGTLTIAASQKLNVPAGVDLSVTGTTTTNDGLVLKSPASLGASGSFLPSGSVSGNITAERYIPAYTNSADGWYFLSSPVAAQSINGNFTPGTTYDVFRWDETVTSLPWINSKGNSFTTFTPGEGYLVSYFTGDTKSFTGALNQSSITLSDQSYTTASAWHGWHLIGNPFSCAILWNKTGGSWGLSNVEAVAQIMNSGGTYTARTANQPIPAMNGFMVHVTGSTNSLTIPTTARTHDATDWFKNGENTREKLMLTAASADNSTYVETIIQFNKNATPAFDMDFDGHFISGVETAPQLYTKVEEEQLCVNTLPQNDETRTIPMGFVKGSSLNYTMNCSGIESFYSNVSIVLEDLKEAKSQDLRQSPVYSFTAADGDNANRFLLHFGGAFAVNDLNNKEAIRIYTANNNLYVSNSGGPLQGDVYVYNLMGQLMMQQQLTDGSLTRISLNAPTGYYLVKVVTGEQVFTSKVFISNQ